MTAFEDFVGAELPRRVAVLTPAMCGDYDGDPNDGGAPAILDNAPIGTHYFYATNSSFWRKNALGAGNWELAGASAAGSDRELQFNDAGILGGATGITFTSGGGIDFDIIEGITFQGGAGASQQDGFGGSWIGGSGGSAGFLQSAGQGGSFEFTGGFGGISTPQGSPGPGGSIGLTGGEGPYGGSVNIIGGKGVGFLGMGGGGGVSIYGGVGGVGSNGAGYIEMYGGYGEGGADGGSIDIWGGDSDTGDGGNVSIEPGWGSTRGRVDIGYYAEVVEIGYADRPVVIAGHLGLDPQSSDPSTSSDGQIWYHNSEDQFKGRRNASTKNFLMTGDSASLPFDSVLTVSQTNPAADYSTIQAAIDAIDGGSPTHIHFVYIDPGTYTEQITIPNYVYLVGAIGPSPGIHPVVITYTYATSGTTVTFESGSYDNGIMNIEVYAYASASGINITGVEFGSTWGELSNVTVVVQSNLNSILDGTCINVDGAANAFLMMSGNNWIFANSINADTSSGIKIDSGGRLDLLEGNTTVNAGGGSVSNYGCNFADTTVTLSGGVLFNRQGAGYLNNLDLVCEGGSFYPGTTIVGNWTDESPSITSTAKDGHILTSGANDQFKVNLRELSSNPSDATTDGQIWYHATEDNFKGRRNGSTLAFLMVGDALANINSESISELSDVAAMTEVTGDLLYYTSGSWNRLAMGTANQFLKVNVGGTALEYGATPSGLQNVVEDTSPELGGDLDVLTHTLTGYTASRALAVDASGDLVVSLVTDEELGYLDGVTSDIQTQINGKSSTVGTVTSVTAGNGMTQSGTASINPTLNVVSHAGSAGSIGTLDISADALGVDLGATGITACAGNDARLSDARTPTAHDLDAHGSATLAELNAVVSNATLIDTGDSRLSDARTPTAHTVIGHSDWPAGVTAAEVGYLSEVTSDIQAQLNGKLGGLPFDDIITVSATNTDADYTTIQAAINAADGSTRTLILIDGGTYNEKLVLDDYITLQGLASHGYYKPVIVSYTHSTSDATVTIPATADHVTLDNIFVEANFVTNASLTVQCLAIDGAYTELNDVVVRIQNTSGLAQTQAAGVLVKGASFAALTTRGYCSFTAASTNTATAVGLYVQTNAVVNMYTGLTATAAVLASTNNAIALAIGSTVNLYGGVLSGSDSYIDSGAYVYMYGGTHDFSGTTTGGWVDSSDNGSTGRGSNVLTSGANDLFKVNLRALTADPVASLGDGDIWYHATEDEYKGRRNGATKDFLMEGDVNDVGLPFDHVLTVSQTNSFADYSTIQAAIDAASSSTLILVDPGVYAEDVVIRGDYIHIKGLSYGYLLDNIPSVHISGTISGGTSIVTFGDISGDAFNCVLENVYVEPTLGSYTYRITDSDTYSGDNALIGVSVSFTAGYIYVDSALEIKNCSAYVLQNSANAILTLHDNNYFEFLTSASGAYIFVAPGSVVDVSATNLDVNTNLQVDGELIWATASGAWDHLDNENTSARRSAGSIGSGNQQMSRVRLEGRTSDPTSAGAGSLWYRSDTDKYVGVPTASAKSFLMEGDSAAGVAGLTVNRALISNGSGDLTVHATVSDVELGYLNGVTSAIQTQLDDRPVSVHGSFGTKPGQTIAIPVTSGGTNNWIVGDANLEAKSAINIIVTTAGETSTTSNIDDAASNGAGGTTITLAATHGWVNDTVVSIVGSTYHDGVYKIFNVSGTDFDIDKTFGGAEGQGRADDGARITIDADTYPGWYKITISSDIQASHAGACGIQLWHLESATSYNNITHAGAEVTGASTIYSASNIAVVELTSGSHNFALTIIGGEGSMTTVYLQNLLVLAERLS